MRAPEGMKRRCLSEADLEEVASRARYKGSEEHKDRRWWGGLPRARQLPGGRVGRRGKQQTTVCPLTRKEDQERVTEWLRNAIRARQFRFVEADRDFPKNSGLDCARIRNQASTRAGPLARKSFVEFSTEWIEGPNASAEERATLCNLKVTVGEENACFHLDEASQRPSGYLTLPAVHLAEGLATDWWSIFGGRDRESPILRYRTGFALPNLAFKSDGVILEVVGRRLAFRNPDLRFWPARGEVLTKEDGETILGEFVERVVARLSQKGVSNPEVAVRWARVSRTLKNPEERAFCEAAGALGLDPYNMTEAEGRLIERAGELFSGEALVEFLAGLRLGGDAVRVFGRFQENIGCLVGRPKENSCLPELSALTDQFRELTGRRQEERSWAPGYRAARALRGAISNGPDTALRSVRSIAKRLGGERFKTGPYIPGVLALVAREEREVFVHLRSGNPARTFAFARAIGDALCFPEAGRSVVNDLHAHRQAAGRAFAAEFLAPVDVVADMVEAGKDTYEIADWFNVAPELVDRQMENQDRIEEACETM